MITGLCLGKFAPLHVGHTYIISEALKLCDKLIIMIYDCPEVINIPLRIRAGWVRDLYSPDRVEVIECYRCPKETGYTKSIMKEQENYILRTLVGRKIDIFFSAEKYGEHVSRALGAEDHRFKKIGNISATKIRKNIYQNQHNLPYWVYNSFITNVVFLGGPSTGKTTMAEVMAKKLKTKWMPEYGREYWDRNNVDRKLTPYQLVELAKIHLMRENTALREANKYLFTDTNAITTYLFHRYYHGDKDLSSTLKEMADACSQRYDIVFLCGDEFPMDNTEDRSGDAQRKLFQQWHEEELIIRKIPYFYLEGTLETRVRSVELALTGYEKWEPMLML